MTAAAAVRIAESADRAGAAWTLLSGADSVCWASGHVVPIETGPSPFAGGPSLALVGPGAEVVLVVTNLEAPGAHASRADRVVDYVGFSAGDPEPLLTNYLAAVRAALNEAGVGSLLAVEEGSLPASVAEILRATGIRTVDVSRELAVTRAVKTPDELVLLRESARVASVAHRRVVEAAREGMSELALFAELRLAAETEAGERVPFAGDLISGVERTAAIGGWPSTRVLGDGDPVIADLAPRVSGYWADSCNTFVVGRASDGLRRMHAAVRAALDAGIAVAGPGVPANELDAAVRRSLAGAEFSYPHHTGHGIGTSVHEYPRLIPGETAQLREGMVILLEPGAYQPGIGGVRLEWMFEVTADGVTPLTDFPLELERE